jgi:predicted NBD/HSP70 family sugar kinase
LTQSVIGATFPDTMVSGPGSVGEREPESVVKLAELDDLHSRGTTQSGVRLYNERLVLSLIRAHENISKAEIARLTGLSAQTVSVIVRELEHDRLVLKGRSIKGKVGQPSQPFSLNPDGAFSIGLKIGRRSGELLLLGLDGKVKSAVRQPYHFPSPDAFMDFAQNGLRELTGGLSAKLRNRIAGLGVAAPGELWKWQEEAGAPAEVMAKWKSFDHTKELQSICPWPVLPCNDASAACAAELFFGNGHRYRSYVYIYVGYFIGGGVVINDSLHLGPTGNAGAIGSMPVPGPDGRPEQLIRSASLYLLEAELHRSGKDPSVLWYSGNDWSAIDDYVDRWVAKAARGIAIAATSSAATIETNAFVIDGAMPDGVRAKLVAAVRLELDYINRDGISPFSIEEGRVGFDARALGAASLPLFANFMTNRDVLFKDVASAD